MDFHLPRPEQAAQIVAAFAADPIFGTRSGLFLAAPRRTGKSTFLRRDLIPLAREKKLYPLYVDLWKDRSVDPGRLIADALVRALEELATGAERLRRAIPFSRIAVGGISVELDDAQGARVATLTDALEEIGARAGKNLLVIIDEAQQALETDAGLDAMFALKAARDAMNQSPEGPRLFLLFTGSHRDKLAALVLDHKAPFYGAEVRDFPRLGRDYTDRLVERVNPRLAPDNQLDPGDVARAFTLLGHRPEKLTEVIRDHALGDMGSAGLRRTVTERADALRARIWQQYESDYGQLSTLQRAVLRVLIEDGADFAPFVADTLARVGAQIGRDVTPSEMQKALDSLREKSILWRPARGVYALEDQDMRDWLLAAP